MSATNPYEAPRARLESLEVDPELERIRRAHIVHEESIRSAGVMYYLLGPFLIVCVALLESMALAVIAVSAGVAFALLGYGLATLRQPVRGAACFASVVGLFAFPFGTLINAYVLWLLLSSKGKRVFAKDYAAIVAATPQVRHQTWALVWIFFAMVAAVNMFALLAPIVSRLAQ